MDELNRFVTMYDQQVKHTVNLVSGLFLEEYSRVPIDSDSNYLDTRVNKINIGSLCHRCRISLVRPFTND